MAKQFGILRSDGTFNHKRWRICDPQWTVKEGDQKFVFYHDWNPGADVLGGGGRWIRVGRSEVGRRQGPEVYARRK